MGAKLNIRLKPISEGMLISKTFEVGCVGAKRMNTLNTEAEGDGVETAEYCKHKVFADKRLAAPGRQGQRKGKIQKKRRSFFL